ncbi:AGE family epimerase/isomerase [Candidatus Latescibacterota bacterium]
MKKTFVIISVISVIVCLIGCGKEPGDDAHNRVSPELSVRLERIQSRVRRMGEDEIDFWTRYGPDPLHGGFYGKIDRRGNGDPDADKGLIQQTRHLITFSLLYSHSQPSEAVKAIADAQYDYIIKTFYDTGKQVFCSRVGADGTPKDEAKQLYTESFAIYSLSLYALVFDNSDAAQIALNCFREMDAQMHDDVHGGFDQTGDHARRLPEGVGKETNTHMHLLESITSLYEATGDPVVKQRVEEMIGVFCKKIFQPENYCHTVFGLDWAPIGDKKVEYGHDLQSAWLLMNAARVLGRTGDSDIIDAVTAMGVHSSEAGFDPEEGGYYYTGMLHGDITEPRKDWWVQAECLSGLWWMFVLTDDTVHLGRMEKILDWLDNNLIDSEYGGWYARIDPGEPPSGSGYKSDYWKSSYHSCRALILVDAWIDGYLK